MKWRVKVLVAQSGPTLCDPMDYRLPASCVHEFSRQEYWSGCHFLLQCYMRAPQWLTGMFAYWWFHYISDIFHSTKNCLFFFFFFNCVIHFIVLLSLLFWSGIPSTTSPSYACDPSSSLSSSIISISFTLFFFF